MPNVIAMDPPKAVDLSPPSMAATPPLVLPSPESKVRLSPLLVDDFAAKYESAFFFAKTL
jgi:hypothetical protein